MTWIHCGCDEKKEFYRSFRNENEARKCYGRFNRIICVSNAVRESFCKAASIDLPCEVLYNIVESDRIRAEGDEPAEIIASDGRINLVAVGTLKKPKGYDRMLSIIKRLHGEGYPVRLYILGIGPMRKAMESYITANNLRDVVKLLGYHVNPYKYVKKCDLMICASFIEGFSTAVMEALILGIPVCTVNVAGRQELLRQENQYGVVTENSEEALYEGIKGLLDTPELLLHYREQALIRGQSFIKQNTVKAVENMMNSL